MQERDEVLSSHDRVTGTVEDHGRVRRLWSGGFGRSVGRSVGSASSVGSTLQISAAGETVIIHRGGSR